MAQADRNEERREDGLTTDERAELNRLRRENRFEGWYNPHRRRPSLG